MTPKPKRPSPKFTTQHYVVLAKLIARCQRSEIVDLYTFQRELENDLSFDNDAFSLHKFRAAIKKAIDNPNQKGGE